MKKLAEKEYWDSVYKPMDLQKKEKISMFGRIKFWLKNATRDYSNYLMWEVLYEKYLPKDKRTVVEVGCAPGKYLIKFHDQFGYEPYGVEYSEKGVEIARENFVRAGISPEHVIQSDFFDGVFQDENKNKYGAVFSRGFIEHFDDVKSVVDSHANLVMPGGYLIIMIPNLRGVNYYVSKFLNIDSLLLHNISIMDKEIFQDLFPSDKFETLYCDYVGIFSFGLFNTNKKWKYWVYRFLLLLQRPVDIILRTVFPKGKAKYKYTSPYLLFIGRKR